MLYYVINIAFFLENIIIQNMLKEVELIMFSNKYKAYKFTIIMCILCLLLIGVSYFIQKNDILLISFIITILGSIIVVLSYIIEKRKQNKK